MPIEYVKRLKALVNFHDPQAEFYWEILKHEIEDNNVLVNRSRGLRDGFFVDIVLKEPLVIRT